MAQGPGEVKTNPELERYRSFVKEKLEKLLPIFAAVSVGDLTPDVEVLRREDEFSGLYSGIKVMLEVIREKIADYEKLTTELKEKIGKETAEIKASEEKLRSLLEVPFVGLFQTSVKGKFIFANRALLKILDFDTLEQMRAANVIDLYKRPKDREFFLKNLREKGEVTLELDIITAKKRDKTVLTGAVIDGKKENISGVAIDITERKKLEWDLKVRLAEIERLNNMMVGRELEMVKLKTEIAALKQQMAAAPGRAKIPSKIVPHGEQTIAALLTKIEELEKLNIFLVGREIEMVRLKGENQRLKSELESKNHNDGKI
ncbi:PAS domain S-box protein [Patescibacteria group bacterium]|nr:MAG: PAS domain S-box protein [Patescibacteria group bacterium]